MTLSARSRDSFKLKSTAPLPSVWPPILMATLGNALRIATMFLNCSAPPQRCLGEIEADPVRGKPGFVIHGPVRVFDECDQLSFDPQFGNVEIDPVRQLPAVKFCLPPKRRLPTEILPLYPRFFLAAQTGIEPPRPFQAGGA